MGGLEKDGVTRGYIHPELLLQHGKILAGQVARASRGKFADADHERDAETHGMGKDLAMEIQGFRAKLKHIPEDRDTLA